MTFEPHTRSVREKEGAYALLTTFEEKARLLDIVGIDYLMTVQFNEEMRGKSPEDFVSKVLIDKLNMAEWVMGQGHAIGRDRLGDENFLHDMEGKYHFITFIIDLLLQQGITVSSTQIREHITLSRIAEAVLRLGHPYLIACDRTSGKKIGRTLGYPTLNFKSPPSRKVIPPPGVYAAEMEYKDRREEGVLYFGDCPTLRDQREVHFEFSLQRGAEEIPVGDRVNLWLYSFVRPDRGFAGIAELVGQIGIDVEKTRTFFIKEKVQWR
ncbi:MAG: hypothetical protein MZV70_77275 [Desulfobacterales bacterium]|nr:hypothetical protein [Desulfobacterales bacterium]